MECAPSLGILWALGIQIIVILPSALLHKHDYHPYFQKKKLKHNE